MKIDIIYLENQKILLTLSSTIFNIISFLSCLLKSCFVDFLSFNFSNMTVDINYDILEPKDSLGLVFYLLERYVLNDETEW